MLNKNKLFLLILLCGLGFSSCDKDNMDVTTIDEDEVEVLVQDCDNSITMTADVMEPINFSATSEVHFFNEFCSQNFYTHNYMVIDTNWVFFSDSPIDHPIEPIEGIPGITFGSDGLPEIGDVLPPFHTYYIFLDETSGTTYKTIDMEITITQISNELGGIIAGDISGTIVDENDPDNSSSVQGSFCSTLVAKCEE